MQRKEQARENRKGQKATFKFFFMEMRTDIVVKPDPPQIASRHKSKQQLREMSIFGRGRVILKEKGWYVTF
jgi:hypothetical protein